MLAFMAKGTRALSSIPINLIGSQVGSNHLTTNLNYPSNTQMISNELLLSRRVDPIGGTYHLATFELTPLVPPPIFALYRGYVLMAF